MRRWISYVVVVMGSLVATALQAAEFFQPAGLIREPLVLSVVLPDGQTATLDAFVTRPNLPGHFPIALITHGTDGSEHSDRDQLTPNRFSAAALSFARHGYAAVVVLRQGYGHSSGHTDYQGNSCDQPKHARAGKMAREDILAALTAMRPTAKAYGGVRLGRVTNKRPIVGHWRFASNIVKKARRLVRCTPPETALWSIIKTTS